MARTSHCQVRRELAARAADEVAHTSGTAVGPRACRYLLAKRST